LACGPSRGGGATRGRGVVGLELESGSVREVGDDGARPVCQPVSEGEGERAGAGPKGGVGCGLLG
jgi:hypothetical protein